MNTTTTRGAGPVDSRSSKHALLRTLPFDAAQITGGFWAEQQGLNRRTSLHHGYAMLHKAGNFHNLRLAAGLATVAADGPYRGRNFYDEDLYKWLEALGWEIARLEEMGADAGDLRSLADEAIALIQAAQEPSGYLDSYYQVVEPEAKWADLDHGHEMYCAGHLIQAAVAFQRALGDNRLLDVVTRLADHIDATFGPGKREGTCGHPEIEMALVELYRVTGEARYLALSQFLVDQRGKGVMKGWDGLGPLYQQDHVPVRAAQGVAGHAVRQVYLESGVTDLYLEAGEHALLESARRLWHDMTAHKSHVTGGVGSRFQGESFGEAYELPSDSCYCETCAAIGSFQWNWRMLLATGDARYAAVMEQTLYNGILVSRSLDGSHYFYANPLQLRGGGEVRLSSNPEDGVAVVAGRPEWHYVACCPPNIMRLLASLGSYLATQDEAGVQIHHFATADLRFALPAAGEIALAMESQYPWRGDISIRIAASSGAPWTLRVRVPAWAGEYEVSVNGEPVDAAPQQGYLALTRAWQAGDHVHVALPIVPRLLQPHHRIEALRGCAAVQMGPVVFALEQVDLPAGVALPDVAIDEAGALTAEWNEAALGGIMQVWAEGAALAAPVDSQSLYMPLDAGHEHTANESTAARFPLRLVPYFRWGNRGMAGMRVWLPRLSLYV